MTEVNAEEEVLKKLYDKHMEEIKADNDKVNK